MNRKAEKHIEAILRRLEFLPQLVAKIILFPTNSLWKTCMEYLKKAENIKMKNLLFNFVSSVCFVVQKTSSPDGKELAYE